MITNMKVSFSAVNKPEKLPESCFCDFSSGTCSWSPIPIVPSVWPNSPNSTNTTNPIPTIQLCKTPTCYNGPPTEPPVDYPIVLVHIPQGTAIGYETVWFEPVKEDVKVEALWVYNHLFFYTNTYRVVHGSSTPLSSASAELCVVYKNKAIASGPVCRKPNEIVNNRYQWTVSFEELKCDSFKLQFKLTELAGSQAQLFLDNIRIPQMVFFTDAKEKALMCNSKVNAPPPPPPPFPMPTCFNPPC